MSSIPLRVDGDANQDEAIQPFGWRGLQPMQNH